MRPTVSPADVLEQHNIKTTPNTHLECQLTPATANPVGAGHEPHTTFLPLRLHQGVKSLVPGQATTRNTTTTQGSGLPILHQHTTLWAHNHRSITHAHIKKAVFILAKLHKQQQRLHKMPLPKSTKSAIVLRSTTTSDIGLFHEVCQKDPCLQPLVFLGVGMSMG